MIRILTNKLGLIIGTDEKMRQITFARRRSIAESRKVPLNTIILPPITPPPQELGPEIIGNFVVNKPKVGTVGTEVVISKPQELPKNEDQSSKTPEQVRLEQNIRFLQDQHQMMLAGLHVEIEKLKSRNRELQFQLIFGKTPVSSSSSPSSPEDDTKHKLYTSPKITTNTTPLQVEILEKELGELKIQMQEQDSRNVYLSAIVDEQKKQLERYDRRREKEQQRTNGPGDAEVELLRKLEDAETLIRRLRRENSDLRRENQGVNEAVAHASHVQQGHQHHRENNGYQSPRGQGHRGGSGRGHRSSNGHNGHYNNRGGWFPPLHSQSFWQGGRPQHDRSQDHGTNLPDIPLNDVVSGAQHHHQQQQYHHGHGRKGSNNNHYHNGDGRKYRGGHHKANKPS